MAVLRYVRDAPLVTLTAQYKQAASSQALAACGPCIASRSGAATAAVADAGPAEHVTYVVNRRTAR
eukprot:10369462-Lingulodinium_polyedra.AAC.1